MAGCMIKMKGNLIWNGKKKRFVWMEMHSGFWYDC